MNLSFPILSCDMVDLQIIYTAQSPEPLLKVTDILEWEEYMLTKGAVSMQRQMDLQYR